MRPAFSERYLRHCCIARRLAVCTMSLSVTTEIASPIRGVELASDAAVERFEATGASPGRPVRS